MQLQLREHGQPGLCHTRHSSWRQKLADHVDVFLEFTHFSCLHALRQHLSLSVIKDPCVRVTFGGPLVFAVATKSIGIARLRRILEMSSGSPTTGTLWTDRAIIIRSVTVKCAPASSCKPVVCAKVPVTTRAGSSKLNPFLPSSCTPFLHHLQKIGTKVHKHSDYSHHYDHPPSIISSVSSFPYRTLAEPEHDDRSHCISPHAETSHNMVKTSWPCAPSPLFLPSAFYRTVTQPQHDDREYTARSCVLLPQLGSVRLTPWSSLSRCRFVVVDSLARRKLFHKPANVNRTTLELVWECGRVSLNLEL